MTIDLPSLLWGVAATVLLFFCGWAAKHVLDRLLLPRLLDWWATRTRARALQRAQILVSNFEYEVVVYADIRMLLYRTDGRLRLIVFIILITLLFSVVIVLRVDTANDLINTYNPLRAAKESGSITISFVRGGIYLAMLLDLGFLWFLVGRPTLNPEMILSPKLIADRTLGRIDKLLVAAGLTDVEQADWRINHAQSLIRIKLR